MALISRLISWIGSARGVIGCAGLALVLTGCGTAANDPLTLAGRALLDTVRPDEQAIAPQTTEQVRQQITPEVFAATGGPLLLAENLQRPGAYILVRVGQGNGTEMWRSPLNTEFWTTGQGLLFGTRGFGNDLMSADVSETAAALRARRAGPVTRMHVYVDGDWQSEQVFIDCDVRFEGRNATETCDYEGEQFRNVYALDGRGRVLQSVQWAGPEIGQVSLEPLYP